MMSDFQLLLICGVSVWSGQLLFVLALIYVDVYCACQQCVFIVKPLCVCVCVMQIPPHPSWDFKTHTQVSLIINLENLEKVTAGSPGVTVVTATLINISFVLIGWSVGRVGAELLRRFTVTVLGHGHRQVYGRCYVTAAEKSDWSQLQ